MQSTPYEMKAYDKAYVIQRKIQDERDWMMGRYVMSAFGTILSQAFSKKGNSKAKYIEKPFLADEKDLSKAKEKSDIATMTKWAMDFGKDNNLPPTIFKTE